MTIEMPMVAPLPPPAPPLPAEEWLRPSTADELPLWMQTPSAQASVGAVGTAAPRDGESRADQRDRAARSARQELARRVARAVDASLTTWESQQHTPLPGWIDVCDECARKTAVAAVRLSVIREQWTNPRNGELALRVSVESARGDDITRAALDAVTTDPGLDAATQHAFLVWAQGGAFAAALTRNLAAP